MIDRLYKNAHEYVRENKMRKYVQKDINLQLTSAINGKKKKKYPQQESAAYLPLL